ncbi:MAG: dienelactone hydrolase family protein, partial [Kiritimatiellaeota bacterium]|nr:dienelactone hydrolase family protein [Kiritimatiellota bacterium]
VMKSIDDYAITPKGVILECPFGTMYQTVCARFKTMHLPSFPMAGILVFWAGVQNGLWAFAHNPVDYAKNITCPAFLLYGTEDEKVSRQEIDAIFNNLAGRKELKVYQGTGHEDYLTRRKAEWTHDVQQFVTH